MTTDEDENRDGETLEPKRLNPRFPWVMRPFPYDLLVTADMPVEKSEN